MNISFIIQKNRDNTKTYFIPKIFREKSLFVVAFESKYHSFQSWHLDSHTTADDLSERKVLQVGVCMPFCEIITIEILSLSLFTMIRHNKTRPIISKKLSMCLVCQGV